jgi:hypothetical protein
MRELTRSSLKGAAIAPFGALLEAPLGPRKTAYLQGFSCRVREKRLRTPLGNGRPTTLAAV